MARKGVADKDGRNEHARFFRSGTGMNAHITCRGNALTVNGALGDFRGLLSELHQAITIRGCSEIVLNLKRCTSAFQSSMLLLCAQILAYRQEGIAFSLIAPDNEVLRSLFRNTNWGHYIDPEQFAPSTFRGYSKIPATQYRNPDEQKEAVDKIVRVLLGAIPDLHRLDFAAFEWSINEITDNVLVHARSPVGGLVQVSTFQKSVKRVQFVVADAGVGIPSTLREGQPGLTSDSEALDKAIRAGVTRDKKLGQGNGLFGSYEICTKCNGDFEVHSGHASLVFISKKKKMLDIKDVPIPCSGTLVVATIDFSNPELLADALQFQGRKHAPVDFVETEYEKASDGNIRFHLISECTSFGSRMAGKPVRIKLSNLYRMSGTGKIFIDMSRVPIMSSSFADEVFGKLFLELGAVEFMQRFALINAMDTVRQLIDKAITQRVSVGIAD